MKSTNSDKIEKTENQRIIDEYDYLGKACSVMDCTGLIPSPPLSDAEIESYESLYPYLPPVINPNQERPRQSPRDTDMQ